jgi:hypothetical protein
MDVQIIAAIVGIVASILAIVEIIAKIKRRRHQDQKGVSIQLSEIPQAKIPVKTREDDQLDLVTESFSDSVKSGKYQQAMNVAERERNKLISSLSPEDPDRQLTIDDFDTWHARAMIYTGETRSALEKLNKIIPRQQFEQKDPQYDANRKQRNMLLGRAYNDRGYANWMDFGHYEIAVQEL